jgi:hypothetical protein
MIGPSPHKLFLAETSKLKADEFYIHNGVINHICGCSCIPVHDLIGYTVCIELVLEH